MDQLQLPADMDRFTGALLDPGLELAIVGSRELGASALDGGVNAGVVLLVGEFRRGRRGYVGGGLGGHRAREQPRESEADGKTVSGHYRFLLMR